LRLGVSEFILICFITTHFRKCHFQLKPILSHFSSFNFLPLKLSEV